MNKVSIGSDNGLSIRRQGIIRTKNIIDWTFRIKIQWNRNQNLYTFIRENASENIVCEVVSFFIQENAFKNVAQ